ncbi:hypothetical protein Cni_G28927 [Canna indica]|uniref:Uncharacterized protein n=1 Tax=Canna indica TaxID=4628 RepID=A0AAQ3L4C0_9LILI|nr:hypothetical protein Cni_G28927 [Canna indica]
MGRGGKNRRSLVNVPIGYRSLKAKKRRFTTDTSVNGDDGDPTYYEKHMEENENSSFLMRRRRCWEGDNVNSIGRRGGMMMLWKKDKMNVSIVHKDDQSISAVVELKKGRHCLVLGIYASTDDRKREQLWKKLSDLDIPGIPWLVMGDLNCIREAREKRGGRLFQIKKSIRDFLEFLNSTDDCEMAEAFADYYEDLWKRKIREGLNLEFLAKLRWNIINDEDKRRLSMKLIMEETWEAVKGLRRGKRPGPDGYIAEFFIHNWSCLEETIKGKIENILSTNINPNSGSEETLNSLDASASNLVSAYASMNQAENKKQTTRVIEIARVGMPRGDRDRCLVTSTSAGLPSNTSCSIFASSFLIFHTWL